MPPNCSRGNSKYIMFPKTRFSNISSIIDKSFCSSPSLFQITPAELLDCVPLNLRNKYLCLPWY